MDNTQRALQAIHTAAVAVNRVAVAVGQTVGIDVPAVPGFSTVPEGLAAFNGQLGMLADGFEGFALAVESAAQPAPRLLPAAAVVQLAGQTVPAIEEGPTGEALQAEIEKTNEKPKRKGSK